MGLQLIGVILIGVGLRDTRRAFNDQPTTLQAIRQWWAGRPRLSPKHVALEARALAIATAAGSARASVSAGPSATLEHRVEVLERAHAALFDEVGKLSAEIRQKIGELSDAITTERGERQQAERSISEQLKKAIAEGLPLARVGAICFFAGIACGSASAELAELLGSGACP